ncbi:cytochrome c [uncultured Paracoccus sp.]|nr:cytochrome c [uncultured Paracoccus sp.]
MERAGLLALLVALPFPCLADDGTGRALYQTGAGLAPVVAGRSRPALADRMTCAGCHGIDGRGGSEGGAARAPAINWQTLRQPTQTRPAYDAPSLARAIRQGTAPDGRLLQMPQFAMTDAQLEALSAHLQDLDTSAYQGLTADSIAVQLPADPAQARAAAAAIAAFNAEGGSFGRQVVADRDAFADLGPLLDHLRGALTGAEARLAQSRQAEGWQVDRRIDPQAWLVLRRDGARAMIVPAPASMIWARENGESLEAARVHALTTLILEELRQSGRTITASAFTNRAMRIDPAAALFVYDDPKGE